MQFHRLAAVAACGAIVARLTVCAAAESPTSGSEVIAPPSVRHFDGWRAARQVDAVHLRDSQTTLATPKQTPRNLTTSDDSTGIPLHVSAQSPDEDFGFSAPAGPNWSYPSRHATTSVPVPGYEGEVDLSRMRGRSEPLALNSIGRTSAASRSRTNAAAASYQYRSPQPQSPEYDSPPPLPSFHPAPFQRSGPTYPTDTPPYQRSRPTYPAEPNPCEPCQQVPFEDPCAQACQGYRYTWDSIYFFALFDAFRLDHESTRAGGRFGFNWALPVIDDDSGLGFQIGLAGSVVEEGPQWFATSGLFYRGDMREDSAWNVGAVFDWMHDNEIDTGIGQLRGMTSITLDRKNEIGLWGALSVIDDNDKRGRKTESVNQANLFYRYLFDSGSDVSAWVGWRSDPESSAVGASWYAPINDYWAGLFGGYYAFDGDTWNVYSGVVRHWGNRARQDYIGQDRHLPYLPVADNSTMTLFQKR